MITLENIAKNARVALPESRIVVNQPMSLYTSMRLGGRADLFVEAKTESEIQTAIDFALGNELPLLILGGGNNIIVRDEGIRGMVLKIDNDEYQVVGNEILAGAAAKITELSQIAMLKSLKGMEFAQGIPGTIGGATIMNAGAYNGQMANVLKSVKYIDKSGKIVVRETIDGDFGYRTSIFAREAIAIVSAVLDFEDDADGSAMRDYEEFRLKRMQKQPLDFPNCGSVFKRPEGRFAGKLIQDSGLVGKSKGGAQVSTKHAGFIVNKGNATASDVIELIQFIQKKVFEDTGVLLETEVKII